ncbi:MAG: nucleoside-diphosphate kinase [Rhodothermaceae bacterium]|nr:nucleoside-diphosphate kinase [Rhodothermaceae bacterium]MYF40793.1 nucleoside-diphosphate kinase [Rhodothermaceae bacterium]
MRNDRTLSILKPDCVRRGLTGEVLRKIEIAGFKVCALKMIKLTRAHAEGFYEVHRDLPFFGDLIDFMTSGPCVPMVLEKRDAVESFRQLIGATDPAAAAKGTIRRLYAENKGENIVHGSDSPENAQKEIAYFFSESGIPADAE